MQHNKTYYEQKRRQALEMYPTMSASEIAAVIGICRETINIWAKNAGVKHTEEANKRLREKAFNIAASAIKANRKAVYKKLSCSRKHIFRMENFRVMNGMKQKTKLKIRTVPVRVSSAMSHVARYYNYFYEELCDLTLYYDEATRRSAKMERLYAERYGLKFEDASEHDKQVVND